MGGISIAMAGMMGLDSLPVMAAEPDASTPPILFSNLKLFDGVNRKVREGVNVLVDKNRISALPAMGQVVDNAQVIDCGGRLLMPGLIDAHWHAMFCGITEMNAMRSTVGYLYLVAAQEAERTLMRGFTSVRDVGGPSFDLKRAIDEGIAIGPRIYPSGAMISQTSGHGDFRMRSEIPRSNAGALSYAEQIGAAAIADGSSEVLRRVREQLMLGASQIKLMAGGGVSSPYDPLDTTQYSEEELRAAVGAAEDWGTYVMVHVYNPRGIQRAVRAGVKSIEHGQLADEESARMMAGEGVWWSLQPFLADDDANFKVNPGARAKQLQVAEGTRKAYRLARDLGIKTAWGTDILFTPNNLASQGRQLAKLIEFYPSLELLQIATAKNGELLDLCGERNPYGAQVGVIAPGALADLLIVDGDPSVNLDFLGEPDKNLQLIMKDGQIYKNHLPMA